MPKNPSPAQISILRSAALGKVWRNDAGGGKPLYSWWVEGDGRSVTRSVEALCEAGLLTIDFADRRRPRAEPTEGGRALLDALRTEALEGEQ